MKKDNIIKLSITYKEARDSKYWLRLLLTTNYLKQEQADSLINDIEEICKVLGSIQTTVKKKIRNS